MQLIVIKDSDDVALGKIEARLGMWLANGYQIIKVNVKSLIARDKEEFEEKFTSPTSVYYTEAKRWGFSSREVDDSVENRAALMRKFRRGEFAYQHYIEYGVILPLSDSIERAGYEFARKLQEMRSSEIQRLMEQEVLEIAQ
jgi:hypothetical protein